MTANRYYGVNNKGLASSLEKLASGYAINKAGDNAAGLAVSEKMRAQIGGLTQASKNAEDGISLVQTMEGALQETDSILQRMRTLAVQSANGSYQDDVDREAMQLEFDQLNDELNQIADTDFNGTVMLNGGQMADGVKAHNGKIDYATKRADVASVTGDTLRKSLESAAQKFNSAKAAYADGKYDLSSNGDAPEWETVDNSKYNKDVADDLWGAFGYTKQSPSGNSLNADTTKADTIAVTFEYDGTAWKAKSATSYLNGDTVESFDETTVQSKLTVAPAAVATRGADAANTGKGGFDVKLTNTSGVKKSGTDAALTTAGNTADALGNAIFDNSAVTKGSTVTLVYSNSDAAKKAPTNIGVEESSLNTTDYNAVGGATKAEISVTAKLAAGVKDTALTDDLANNIKAMNGLKVSYTYDDEADFKQGQISINGKEITVSDDAPANCTELRDDEGNSVFAYATTAGVIHFVNQKDASAAATTAPVELGTVTVTADAAADAGKDTGAGEVSFKLSLSTVDYNSASSVTITAGDNPNLDTSASQYNAVKQAGNELKDAGDKLNEFNKLNVDNEQDWEKIKTMYAESQSSSGSAVSVSDSFDQSRATMTYTDQLGLQVGARTKDLVNFTFSYNSNGLGDLKANLNCSSREDGLGTAKLSIADQKSANDAIDKIDNAINKVNMVRATFGAAQNRIEHKINNIDTNTENLTAAESRIRDTQMDKEMMKFTSSQILSQASQSMLAQANQLPQGVLQLLG